MVDDGRTTDDGRRTPDHGHPISSPCEPDGSGELKSFLKRAPGPGLLSIYIKTVDLLSVNITFQLEHSFEN